MSLPGFGSTIAKVIASNPVPIYALRMRFREYLLSMGYRPFCGQVGERVFGFFGCPHPDRAEWYVNRTMCSYQCLGCPEQCETDDPGGFQPFLPWNEDTGDAK